MTGPTPCPSCRQTTVQTTFERQLHGSVELDLCFSCQDICFDEFESVQITPGGIIRCLGCGALVDIRKDHTCSHCRAPITILDPTAIEQALARYQHAEVRRTTRDVELLGDAIVMREREKFRLKRMKQDPKNAGILDAIDLISAGAEFVWHLIRR